MTERDLDLCIAALEAVRLARQTYASGPRGARSVQHVAEMLALNDKGPEPHGGLCKNVAEAILKAYGGDAARLADPERLRNEAPEG